MASKVKQFDKLGSTQQEMLQMLWDQGDFAWNPADGMPEGWEDWSLAGNRVMRSLSNYAAIVNIPTEMDGVIEHGRVLETKDGTFKYEVLDEIPEDEADEDEVQPEPEKRSVRVASDAPRKSTGTKQMASISGAQPTVTAESKAPAPQQVSTPVVEVTDADVEAAKAAIRNLMGLNNVVPEDKLRTMKTVLSAIFQSQYETQRLTKELAVLIQGLSS